MARVARVTRLSFQTLLDVRLSRTRSFRRQGRIEVLMDVLNALNDPTEEALATDNLFGPTFGRGVAFVDPRLAMVGIRLEPWGSSFKVWRPFLATSVGGAGHV